MQKQDAIQVCIRVKPGDLDQCLTFTEKEVKLDKYHFGFDKVFCPNATQDDVFYSVGHRLLNNTLEGYNGCIFVYGQTGSGKTYTMIGGNNGVMQKSFQELFVRLDSLENSQYFVNCSYFELYNEQVIDLLDPRKDKKLHVRQDSKKGMFVENLTEETAFSAEKLFQCLEVGMKNRHVGETMMNQQSSRSHSVFTLSITFKINSEGGKILKSPKLHFVDLAGSERQKLTAASGDRLKEAGNINKSLTTLGMVINALTSEKPRTHIPYRDSKLTTLLRDCLGGNSKTFIIATISSSLSCFQETLSTLNFANRAKMVKVRAQVNQECLWSNVQSYKEEIKRLKAQIARIKNQKKTVSEPKQIHSSLGMQHHFKEINNKISIISQQLSKNVCSPAFESILQRLENGRLQKNQSMITQEEEQQGDALMQYLNSNYQLLSQVNNKVNEYLQIKHELRMTALSGKLSVQSLKSPSKNQRLQYDELLAKKDSINIQLKQEIIRLHNEMTQKDLEILELKQNLSLVKTNHKQQSVLTNNYRQSLYAKQRQVLSLKAKVILCEQQKSRTDRNNTDFQKTIKQLRELYHYAEQKLESETFMRGKIESQMKDILEKVSHLESELALAQEKHQIQTDELKFKIETLEDRQMELRSQIQILEGTSEFHQKKANEFNQKLKINQNQLHSYLQTISTLNYQIVKANEYQNRTELQIKTLQAIIRELEHNNRVYLSNIAESKDQYATLNQEFQQHKQKSKQSILNLSNQLEQKINVLSDIKQELYINKQESFVKINKLNMSLQAMEKTILEQQQRNKILRQKIQQFKRIQAQLQEQNKYLQESKKQLDEKLIQQRLQKDKHVSEIQQLKMMIEESKTMRQQNETLKKSYQNLVKQNYRLKGNRQGKYQNSEELSSKVQYYQQKFKLMSIQYKKATQCVKKMKEREIQQSKQIKTLQQHLRINRTSQFTFPHQDVLTELEKENTDLKKQLSFTKIEPNTEIGTMLEEKQEQFRQMLKRFILKWDPNINTNISLDQLIQISEKLNKQCNKRLQGLNQAIQREQKLKSQNHFILKENIYIKQKLASLQKQLHASSGHSRKIVKVNEI